MNSYPPEFLSHPQPLMFVGGLGTSPPPPNATRKPSNSEVPLTSPEPELTPLPQDEFAQLATDLRSALAPYTASPRVWGADNTDFRVVLVDKAVKLPLRKAPEGHSPLSPLTPASPLHPDGLIAPVWVRKHTELLPSVFVLFLRLYEPGPGEDVERQREADEATVREIADRRRRLGERGIRLTVVLLASAATLEAEGLDARLSAIRRASQLSAKASLFVLTPVRASELPDFVRNLFDALREPALEYYAAHGKRVRRKRGRGARPRSNSVAGRSSAPLSQQGWTIRYDFKAGWFAEVRGELDLARRHYEDCWNELARMFASTSALPPRTKRWAEAKVLADCLAVRICKLQLYEGARVLVPFYVHVRRFADLSRGWGIGEDTFEFWSWLARQYRIFGEVLELALAHGFVLPPLPAPGYPSPPTGNVLPPSAEEMNTPTSSANALHVLQPPAFYFYTAATCTLERKARYAAAAAAERAAGSSLAATPGFANEKSVDHAALAVELLGKASAAGDPGLAMYAALRMAQVQAEAGLFAAAGKTLAALAEMDEDRQWAELAAQRRALWLECARATGDVDTAVRLLASLPSQEAEDDLLGLLATTKPASSDPIVSSAQVVALTAGFRASKAATGSTVPFQLVLAPSAYISNLTFSRLRVSLSDGTEIVVTHGGSGRDLSLGAISGTAEVAAPLAFPSAEPLVLTGTVSSDGELEVLGADLTLAQDGWTLLWRLEPSPLVSWRAGGRSFLPSSGVFPSVTFAPPPHAISLEVQPPSVGFVGESVPVTIRVASTDARALQLSLSVLLQPGEESDGSTLAYGEERGALLKDIPLALVDGAAEAVVHLVSPAAENKMLDVSLISTANGVEQEMTHTAVVSVIEPFSLSISTQPVKAGALLAATLSVRGPRGVVVEGMELVAEGAEVASSSLGSVAWPQTWDRNSSFSLAAKFTLPARAPPASAVLRVQWRPAPSQLLTATLPLGALLAPPPEAFVTAALASPATVRAHAPFALALTLANAHPDADAWLTVHGETADAFVWAGPRGARVPVPAGESVVVDLGAVPVGASGWQALPHVAVWLGEGADRREVRVAAPSGVLVQP
ncbi:hypothetical protein CC85DRAFT_114458 [Cutaneotrichosporon oleaginosum]|uniref:Trafficking protein particle complex subunit 11 domain-containing protein n=1 Tax=Cutaneotrichosporon oleaginosum TaxID=879819 RepID=A0A0J0XXC0_9TREE|nr:uncharacterized protein CC85DRAFT_114458 [Cutaneotrichosporon oleaginosum]KLT45693.1 hypothetical protein CC85DRAFT_114458 [Cutaneotrichosporon oleaginosum]TXT04518.1 hypothetical protein COLE_07337 [Cutaneotrichosporon oleaginosum]